MADATLVFEAVVERLEVKHALYAEPEAPCSPMALLIASNTSGFMPDVLCERMQHPERFLAAVLLESPACHPVRRARAGDRDGLDASAAVRERLEHAGLRRCC